MKPTGGISPMVSDNCQSVRVWKKFADNHNLGALAPAEATQKTPHQGRTRTVSCMGLLSGSLCCGNLRFWNCDDDALEIPPVVCQKILKPKELGLKRKMTLRFYDPRVRSPWCTTIMQEPLVLYYHVGAPLLMSMCPWYSTIILYCTLLHRIASYLIALYRIILYYIVSHHMVLYLISCLNQRTIGPGYVKITFWVKLTTLLSLKTQTTFDFMLLIITLLLRDDCSNRNGKWKVVSGVRICWLIHPFWHCTYLIDI